MIAADAIGWSGAKLSEHGKGNALDLRSFKLANGKVVGLTDPHIAKDVRERLRQSACTRFTTVLGPGSDGYHENHVHVDLAERRSGYRICQWDVREPGDAGGRRCGGGPAAATAAFARVARKSPAALIPAMTGILIVLPSGRKSETAPSPPPGAASQPPQ